MAFQASDIEVLRLGPRTGRTTARRRRNGGDLGHAVVPTAAVAAAVRDGNFATFRQLRELLREISALSKEINLVAIDEVSVRFLRLTCSGPLFPFGDLTDCRVHPMLDSEMALRFARNGWKTLTRCSTPSPRAATI